MSSIPNRVHRLRWVAKVGNNSEASQLHRYLRAEGGDQLLAALEQALDEASPPAHVLKLPKLEVQVRFSSIETALAQLPERLHRELVASLRGLVETQRASLVTLSEHGRDELWQYLETGRLPQLTSSTRVQLQVHAREHAGETLRWLARRPAVAWFRWLQLLDVSERGGERALPAELAARLTTIELTREVMADPGEATREQASARPRSTSRSAGSILRQLLVDAPAQLSDHERLSLAAAMLAAQAGDDAAAMDAALARASRGLDSSEPRSDDAPASSRSDTPSYHADTPPTPASTPPARVSTEPEPEDAVSNANVAMVRGAVEIASELDEPESSPAVGPTSLDAIVQYDTPPPDPSGRDPTRATPSPVVPATVDEAPPVFSAAPESASALAFEHPESATLERPRSPEDLPAFELAPRSATLARAIPIRSAGLILLHPFLPTLFTRLRLAPATPGPLPEAALARAAALLYYLATGEDDPIELELGLIKLLVGLRPDTPLLVAGGLVGETEREEAQALLVAVIQHWSALGGTSVEGLRTTFLRRFGLVREIEGGFQLHVESGPFDMLLDRLPWALGIVKLAWMPEPVFTEWSYG